MKIQINENLCVGCGRCTEICPQTFRLNEKGKTMVIQDNDLACAKKAADNCPTEAIEVEE